MQQQTQNIHQSLQRIQLQLNQHIKKLTQLQHLASPPAPNSKQTKPTQQQIGLFHTQIRKSIKKTKQQIQHIIQQYNQHIQQNNDMQTKYNILHATYKTCKQSMYQLKQQLTNNKKIIQKYKKLQYKIKDIHNQWAIQQSAVNKLQHAYNNSIRLQNQITGKIKEIDSRQRMLIAKIQAQQQKDIIIQVYKQDSEQYNKLLTNKQNINKMIQKNVGQYNSKHTDRQFILKNTIKKIKDIDEIYNQLDISIAQQQLIIKQIMMRQNITSDQLLQDAKLNSQDGLGIQHQVPTKILQNNLIKYKRKNQLHLSQRYPNTNKIYTQPTPYTQKLYQKNNISDQLMRITTKILKPQIREATKKRQSLPFNQYYKNNNSGQVKSMPKQKQRKQIRNNSLVPITHSKQQSTHNINKKYNKLDKQKQRGDSSQIYSEFSKIIPQNKPNNQQYSPSSQDQKKSRISNFIRIRTKGGFFYKKNTDDTIKNYTSRKISNTSSREKSQIITIYEKLANQSKDIDNQCLCDDSQLQSKNFMSDQEKLLPLIKDQEKANDKINDDKGSTDLNSGGIKLPKSRRKGKQATKNMIQSRESDGEQFRQQSSLKKKLLEEASKAQINNHSNRTLKQQDSFDNNQFEKIRRRLTTIHEKQQQTNKVNN